MQRLYSTTEPYLQQNKVDSISYRKKFLLLTIIFFLLRLTLAFVLELGNDEAYYWLYSQYWQWNYFDHPPMIAVWIRLFTANLALDQFGGFIRLGSVVGCALASWFLFKAVALLHSEKAGWFAAVLYNVSFYSGVTAGIYTLPDSPQMVFWTLAILLIVKITKHESRWSNWLLFGMISGLCIMSKVHGVFLWLGLGGYILFQRSAWLKKPQLYVALLITFIMISPILFWNVKYDFATFRFHGNRVDLDEAVFRWRFFLRELTSQIGFNNPVNFFLVLLALLAWYKKQMVYQPALAICIFIAMPLIALLLFISCFKNVTLPHWSGPAYVSLIPLAAVWLANLNQNGFPKVLRWGLAVFLVLYIGYSLIIKLYPGTYGSQEKEIFGRGDITLDMYGWRSASKQFEQLYKNDVNNGMMPAGSPLITSIWWGAHVEYYFAHPLNLKMIGLARPEQLNEYLWTNKWRVHEVDLNSAYCVIPSDDKYPVPSDYFAQKELAAVIEVKRNGKPAHDFWVYRLRGLKRNPPMIK